ncbi:phosphopeptide-binding protein [Marivirga arenosa]|uniref:Phosphopeptide-binding protein n=1 Tax=Marivirga arenosa TaxID=3059076 RepID=A0AA49JBA8_9BACT|nr:MULTISPECIES: phosphopeptide-binding protein [unclassified Marivirga]WKK86974.1 phosphopeptide-binding protein [Marivirga sp. ABR2-2]WNB18226.1 phosphopeptide-binding protein [Marivirga sp. BKB1-2]
MKKATIRFTFLFAIATIFACSTGNKEEKAQTEEENTEFKDVEETTSKIMLTPVESPQFDDSMLEMLSPMENEVIAEAGAIDFSYNVKNYELGTQTIDADIKNCANSGKGQHIHLILNNQPYTAHYEAEFTKDLEEGHYVALSFLSRSYHESVKSYGAANIRQFTVGREPNEDEVADLSAPHMFYSRPKGTYVGKDAEKVLLDFYLLNTDLALDGNTVRATINGQEFMLDKWQPYFIEGAEMGEMTVKLELLDKEGNLVDSPFNPVERTVMLKEGDAS